MVSRDIIPNKKTEYDKLSYLVSDARRAGLIDWDAVEDRTRFLRGFTHYNSPGKAIKAAADEYAIDLWQGQENYLEVWIEKDALVDIAGHACNEYDVPFFSCRGYTSDSEIYRAGRRLRRECLYGRTPVILHLGDHDPSGIDMSRDILERLEMFGRISGKIDFHRIALNRDQIDRYNPPPNPAKETDSRFEAYIRNYGPVSWELDALEPRVLTDLIQDNIRKYLDIDLYNKRCKQEREERDLLLKAAAEWGA